jgi:hypothetical protein
MPVGSLEFIKSASGTSVSSLSVTDCFSADYDVYYCTFEFERSGINANQANLLTFLNTSGTDSTADYDYASLQIDYGASFTERKGNHTTILWITYDIDGASGMYIYNPYSSSSYTFVNSSASGQAIGGWKTIATHKATETVAGLKWTFNGTGQYDNITVNVYGVK